jgi:hypothetical protein
MLVLTNHHLGLIDGLDLGRLQTAAFAGNIHASALNGNCATRRAQP